VIDLGVSQEEREGEGRGCVKAPVKRDVREEACTDVDVDFVADFWRELDDGESTHENSLG
jgi:hypothetical protein